jgi:hypothetical protein
MHSTRHLSFALGSPALLGFVLGACFNGEQAEGLPCTANSHCGPKLECIDGYCGGNTTQVYDQCAGEDEPFEFELGPTGPGVSNPIGVLGGQFVGDDRQDLLIAQNDGSFVRIWDVPPGEQPESYDLVGDDTQGAFFTTGVQAVIVYDFEQDTDTDIVVLTEDTRLFGYYSDPAAGAPALADGAPYMVPGSPKLVGMAMGKLNADAWGDFVAVTDGGFVVTATGDAVAGMAGLTPFMLDVSATVLDGSAWQVVDLHDVDEDGLDELLVSGFDGDGPRLWILGRKDGMVLADFWEPLTTVQLPFPANEFALGDLDGTPGADIAIMERMSGQLAVLRQGPQPGQFNPTGPVVDLGVGISGLALVDFDCAGHEDLVFNAEDPASVGVLFTNDLAEITSENSLEIASAGRPRGSLALLKFDPDQSWDVFHAVEAGDDLDSDEFRGLLTQVPDMP